MPLKFSRNWNNQHLGGKIQSSRFKTIRMEIIQEVIASILTLQIF